MISPLESLYSCQTYAEIVIKTTTKTLLKNIMTLDTAEELGQAVATQRCSTPTQDGVSSFYVIECAKMDVYRLFRTHRQRRQRGGVALHMREGLDFMELTYSDERVECLWVNQEKGQQGRYCGRRML